MRTGRWQGPGLPDTIIQRQPFPAGLAIRIIGEVTQERVSMLQEADEIIRQEVKGTRRTNTSGSRFHTDTHQEWESCDERTLCACDRLRIVESEDRDDR